MGPGPHRKVSDPGEHWVPGGSAATGPEHSRRQQRADPQASDGQREWSKKTTGNRREEGA